MICKINNSNKSKVKLFIKKNLKTEINENVLNNIHIIEKDEQIYGCISYEEYDNIVLVRYFIYKNNVKDEVKDLFIELLKEIKEKECNNIISFVNVEQEDIFLELGFKKTDIENIYIEEKKASILHRNTLAYIYYITP